METEKRPSKGMRKHNRRQKAQERKQKDKQQKAIQLAATLPAYESFPRRIRGSTGWLCPHCKNKQYYLSPIKKTIKTQEGLREIFQCEYTHCNGLFRP